MKAGKTTATGIVHELPRRHRRCSSGRARAQPLKPIAATAAMADRRQRAPNVF